MSDAPTTEASETTRVTLSLPTALVRELDARLANSHATRDEVLRRLLEDVLPEVPPGYLEAQSEHDVLKASRRFQRLVREARESEDEFGWTTSPVALAHLAEIPWESDVAPSGGRNSRRRGAPDPSS